MSYEYLKGMGEVTSQTSRSGLTPPPPSGTPSTLVLNAQLFGASAPAPATTPNAAPVNIVIQAVAFEPTVPAGSVKTSTGERVQLKEWCRRVFGETSGFYKEKLQKDPSFTYVPAATLAGYRNAVAVVIDMLRGYRNTNVTLADVTAFKSWWQRCHPMTYHLFSMQPQVQQDTMWVPLVQSNNYNMQYKATNACPTGTAKTNFFEYKQVVTSAQLLAQEKTRQQNVQAATSATNKISADESAARAKDATAKADAANRLAADAQKRADAWKSESDKAKQNSKSLQKSVTDMQKTIDDLNKRLSDEMNRAPKFVSDSLSPKSLSLPDSKVVSDLQNQITALTQQLAAAQAQVPVVAAQAETTQATADQTMADANQAQAVAEMVSAEAAALQPWYIQYKWYLLGGAAILAAGAYWYMSKRPGSVPAIVKNWLPEPTSPRHPSGLKRNRISRTITKR